ncbi:hypothetical protein AVT69_gp350 [Pseudomonas phage PhiPA3]|uniref:Uncharacterized protein 352 n=1 Tax=Pseudomonas phage PhiPA3 TaxID=998086 RepID=F8SJI6_BPPA3|nr:hypothetical protein AVT69_gp350 [Pseudomonas phage PhiPA3]AEH03775.1 hypothetical protein [Pseudomonas phage PhiPA3]
MSSQLVVVDLLRGWRKVNFSELAREPHESLMDYVGEETELASLHQFSYHREYSDRPSYQIDIWWDEVPQQARPENYEPSVKEAFVHRLCKLYAAALGGFVEGVKHIGQTTHVYIKVKEEKALPVNLDWIRNELPVTED